ncbi:MAG: GyrI-like domain-containing protein [Bacteroidales bacterium]|nr:MAG: GyrI-like domain-containing protein [Bacteroidales bacterium]
MKKLNMFATIIALFLIQSMVFGNDLQKPDMKSKDDTTKKCSKIDIEVKEIEASKALTIRATTPSGEISTKLGEIYQDIIDCMNENEIEMAGPPFARYYSWDPEGDTDLEAGMPVYEEAECEGVIEFVELPACKVVTSLHVGPYESLGPVYEAIQEYIDKKGLKINGAVWEVYLTDPATEPDPNNYKTQVYYPVE